jgi:hypothetical protein
VILAVLSSEFEDLFEGVVEHLVARVARLSDKLRVVSRSPHGSA